MKVLQIIGAAASFVMAGIAAVSAVCLEVNDAGYREL